MTEEEGHPRRGLDPEFTISHAVYCGRCGYSLYTLPYRGICPECGQEYNANALEMKGIFKQDDMELPVGEGLGFCVFAMFAILLISVSIDPFQSGKFFIGLIMGAMGLVFAVRTYARLQEFIRCQHIAKRIRKQERD
jgi:hypothetical protein